MGFRLRTQNGYNWKCKKECPSKHYATVHCLRANLYVKSLWLIGQLISSRQLYSDWFTHVFIDEFTSDLTRFNCLRLADSGGPLCNVTIPSGFIKLEKCLDDQGHYQLLKKRIVFRIICWSMSFVPRWRREKTFVISCVTVLIDHGFLGLTAKSCSLRPTKI